MGHLKDQQFDTESLCIDVYDFQNIDNISNLMQNNQECLNCLVQDIEQKVRWR